mgnify:CR=1 FL=1
MSGFFSFLFGGSAARAEKRRLEAFFGALPLEYCGWGPGGSLIYSRGFTRLLGIDRLTSIHDIENALNPSDAAAVESLFLALTQNAESFSTQVRILSGEKILKISGARGRDLGGRDGYDIIWLQDVTPYALESDDLKSDLKSARDDRKKLQNALDAFPMPVWIADSLTDICWVNAAYAKALNKPASEITEAQVWLPLTFPGSTEEPSSKLKNLIRTARSARQAQSVRARLIVGGQRRVAEFCFLPVIDTDLVVIQATDVTMEEDQAAEYKRYVTAHGKLLEQITSAVAIFGADTKLEFHNSAFGRLWNMEESYLNEQPRLGDLMEKLRELRRLPEQADFRAFKKGWIDMFTGLLHPHEDMLYLPNGAAVRMLVAPHPMGGLMMLFEDVTSRLALESSYNTLMAVQRETLENLAEGVAVFGPDGRLKFFNPRFMRMWNLNPEDLEGEPHVTQLVDRQRKFFKLGWKEVEGILTSMGLQRKEQNQQLHRDDDTVLECSSVPMPDGGVMVTHRDITDKTRVETALREKAQALEEAEKLKTDFLANVSYQLRTPLNAMTGFAEILSERYFGELNDKQQEYTKGIIEAGTRLTTLIDDILDLSQIEAGYLSLRLEEVDVQKLLTEVFELTREWAGRETLQASLSCPADIGVLRGDARRLKQVLVNLIRNAINFTPGGGSITLSAVAKGDSVRITVKDTGIGISSDDQSGVFAPFQRSATTTAKGAAAGPGLGLSIVRDITRLHGGDVRLQSQVGEGTEVSITLPRSGPAN